MSTFFSYLSQVVSIILGVGILFCFVSIIIRAIKLKKQTKKLGIDQVSLISVIFSVLSFIAFFIMLYTVKEQTELTYNLLTAVSFIATGTLILFVLRTIYFTIKKNTIVDQKIGLLAFWVVAIFAIYTITMPILSSFAASATQDTPTELPTPPTPEEATSIQAQ